MLDKKTTEVWGTNFEITATVGGFIKNHFEISCPYGSNVLVNLSNISINNLEINEAVL